MVRSYPSMLIETRRSADGATGHLRSAEATPTMAIDTSRMCFQFLQYLQYTKLIKLLVEQFRIQQLLWILQLIILQLIFGRIKQLTWSDSATSPMQKLVCSDSETNDSETNVFGFRD